ncbi:MAG: hypothetical protein R6V02_03925 [Candidatus Aminicenantes bacterium]
MEINSSRYSPPSKVEILLLRDRLGMGRYRKLRKRSPEKRKILRELALSKIKKAEENDFIPLGFRKRRVLMDSKK